MTFVGSAMQDQVEKQAKGTLYVFLKDKSKLRSMRNTFIKFYNRIVNIQKTWKYHLNLAVEQKAQLKAEIEQCIDTLKSRIIMTKSSK